MTKRWLIALGAGLAVDAGCSQPTRAPVETPRPVNIFTDPVTTRDVTWNGWSAIEQTNGLITMRHVPAAGGRTLSLEINGDDVFLVFPENRGKTYAAGSREGSVHFGGHYACIGPERIWNVNDQPFSASGGPYDVRRETGNPDQHTLLFSSQRGTSGGATIAMERAITLYRGNTHVTIDEKVVNKGDKPLEFYLWDFTQIDAGNHRDPAAPLRNMTFYVPVSHTSGSKPYTVFFENAPEDVRQFQQVSNGVLPIRYAAGQFKIAAHPKEWWIAAVDHDTGWTYIKMFDPQPQALYVDDNGPVEVYGSSMTEPMGQPFVEMELLTGIGRYRPGEALVQREHWFATSCRGPIARVTPVGVVCDPLKVSRPGDGTQLSVSIRFGVFYLGTLQASLLDVQGKTLYAAEPKAVNPCFEYVFKAALPYQAAARDLVLEVFDYRHNKVGELARALLR